MEPMRRVQIFVALLVLSSGCAPFKRFMYEGWGRDSWQQPDRVVDALDIKSGDRIADVGAGGGYFTFRLAQAVGPQGVVYAVDIDPDMIGYLRERVAEEKVANVEVVEATPTDPTLPDSGIDLLFTCNTYHHIEDPIAYFRDAKRDLRPGGRVAIVDLNGKGWMSWLIGHSTSADKMRADMQAAGYTLIAQPAFLDQQNFMIFAPS